MIEEDVLTTSIYEIEERHIQLFQILYDCHLRPLIIRLPLTPLILIQLLSKKNGP